MGRALYGRTLVPPELVDAVPVLVKEENNEEVLEMLYLLGQVASHRDRATYTLRKKEIK